MTEKQNEILSQFKSNLGDILNPSDTDEVLLKFLRARNFNLIEAEDNFRAVHGTRILYGINTITENYEINEVLKKYSGDVFLGYAKDGSAIRYITFRLDFTGFIHSVSSYDLYRHFCYVIESDKKSMREENMKTGRNCNEITYILDVEGYSIQDMLNKSVIESGLDHFRQFQDFFPEIWRNIFIINVPFFYDRLYSIFKPIFKETLVRKLRFATKSSTPELLRKYIDDDVLPVFLGGKRVDSNGDPKCSEFMNMGGKIPEKYYLKNCAQYIEASDPGVKVTVIGAGSVFNYPVIVKEVPARIRGEVRTENGSIAFAVFYREFGPDPENTELPASDEIFNIHDEKCNVKVMTAKLRGQTHIAPNDGFLRVFKPGIYILQFDNTSSWIWSRKLFFRTTVLTGEWNH